MSPSRLVTIGHPKFIPKTVPSSSTITTPIWYTHPSTDPTYHSKHHPDPISRFAIIHFPDRQIDRQTDRQMDRQLCTKSAYALFIIRIMSDALTRNSLTWATEQDVQLQVSCVSSNGQVLYNCTRNRIYSKSFTKMKWPSRSLEVIWNETTLFDISYMISWQRPVVTMSQSSIVFDKTNDHFFTACSLQMSSWPWSE